MDIITLAMSKKSGGGITPEQLAQIEQNKNDISRLSEEIADLGGVAIPDYWKEHLTEKIEAIKALHRQYGRDCFSFVHIADPHYPLNLGKHSPLLAKKIMDETQIKFAISNGDMQTRGCHDTKDELLEENELILEMFKPILKKTLFQRGNHDGAYGRLDKDSDGTISNNDSEGNIKEPSERETYVHNLTPQEFHEYCYRKVGMVGGVHFDETGTAYYIDDIANNARFIGLNTQCNDYELQADGTQKYPTMWIMRYTQAQFDFLVNKALVGLDDDTKIVVFGHVPPTQELGDGDLMIGVLKAFKDKTTYSGIYEGTAEGGTTISYTNLAEPLDNTTDTTKWINDHRISSTAISAQSGKTVCNPIDCVQNDVIRIKGVEFEASADRVFMLNTAGNMFGIAYVSTLPNDNYGYEYVDGVHIFTILSPQATTFRCAFTTPTDPSSIIITKNEEIVETTSDIGYDHVEVDCDFTNAKGKLSGYFHGHTHVDSNNTSKGFNIVGSRCDAKEENDATLKAERVVGTITEQSFDVFTITPKKIYATKIGAGSDRVIDII